MDVDVPKALSEWRSLAKKHKVHNVSIYDLKQPHESASKIKEPQYFALRSIWRTEDRSAFKPDKWGILNVEKALAWLKERGDWTKYLKALQPAESSIVPVEELGSFSFSCFARRQISRVREVDEKDKLNVTPVGKRLRRQDNQPSPEKSPMVAALERKAAMKHPAQSAHESFSTDDLVDQIDYISLDDEQSDPNTPDDSPWEPNSTFERKLFPAVEDEEIVNYFLIGFLSSLTFHMENVRSEWSPIRKAFNFGKGTKNLFQARTDGQLCLSTSAIKVPRSQVIVEVKPITRGTSNRIIYQATAQMAAWIFAEPDENQNCTSYRRLMILQERHQVRIAIAEYDKDYVNYIQNDSQPAKDLSLMAITEYGPWDIEKATHMREFGAIIIALTMQKGELIF